MLLGGGLVQLQQAVAHCSCKASVLTSTAYYNTDFSGLAGGELAVSLLSGALVERGIEFAPRHLSSCVPALNKMIKCLSWPI
jgi:hypothetical protein